MARELTPDDLRAVLRYNAETGDFVWLVDGLRTRQGNAAGFRGGKGYWQIHISGTTYYAHRLAFLYVTGQWPTVAVDHIDGDRMNNAWQNLRQATIRQNAANMRKRRGTSSTLKGASWMASKKAWVAHIRIGGKSTYLGMFGTEAEAHAAYVRAASHEFGKFARVA